MKMDKCKRLVSRKVRANIKQLIKKVIMLDKKAKRGKVLTCMVIHNLFI